MSTFLEEFNTVCRVQAFPVHSPLSLLAVAVIGSAVDDQRRDSRYIVRIAASWLQLADVDPQLLRSEGVEVDDAVNLHWQFG